MKAFVTSLAPALLFVTLAAPAMASTRFSCPSEDKFLSPWTESVNASHRLDTTTELGKAQAEAYAKIWSKGVPNDYVRANTFTLDGKDYDLAVTAGDFVGRNPDYIDSYGIIFEKGQSEAIAVIKTDTDRSDYQCTAVIFKDLYVLPAAEFEALAIQNPEDSTVVINGVRYEHFHVVYNQYAFATNPHGDTITFVRGE